MNTFATPEFATPERKTSSVEPLAPLRVKRPAFLEPISTSPMSQKSPEAQKSPLNEYIPRIVRFSAPLFEELANEPPKGKTSEGKTKTPQELWAEMTDPILFPEGGLVPNEDEFRQVFGPILRKWVSADDAFLHEEWVRISRIGMSAFMNSYKDIPNLFQEVRESLVRVHREDKEFRYNPRKWADTPENGWSKTLWPSAFTLTEPPTPLDTMTRVKRLEEEFADGEEQCEAKEVQDQEGDKATQEGNKAAQEGNKAAQEGNKAAQETKEEERRLDREELEDHRDRYHGIYSGYGGSCACGCGEMECGYCIDVCRCHCYGDRWD